MGMRGMLLQITYWRHSPDDRFGSRDQMVTKLRLRRNVSEMIVGVDNYAVIRSTMSGPRVGALSAISHAPSTASSARSNRAGSSA